MDSTCFSPVLYFSTGILIFFKFFSSLYRISFFERVETLTFILSSTLKSHEFTDGWCFFFVFFLWLFWRAKKHKRCCSLGKSVMSLTFKYFILVLWGKLVYVSLEHLMNFFTREEESRSHFSADSLQGSLVWEDHL